ncbi:MAG: hypothetical protein ABIL70_03225 [candidate division WOR-3 bacterium]
MDIGLGFYGRTGEEKNYKAQRLSGNTSLDFDGRMESEPRVFEGKLSFFYSPFLDNIKWTDTVNHRDEKLKGASLWLVEALSGDFYINNSNLFWLISGNGSVDWNYYNIDSNYSHDVYGNFDATGGIGLGRLRDGTASYKAMEIVDILIREKVIEKKLKSDEILGLAQLLNQKWNFQLRYQRYEKFYYKEIEDYLKSIGIYRIPAYVWFKIKEVIDEDITPREFGLKLSGGFGLTGYGYASYSITDGDTLSELRGDPLVHFKTSLRLAYPLTYRFQLKEMMDLTITEKSPSFSSSLSLIYLIYPKFVADISYDWQDYLDQLKQKRIKNHIIKFTLNYYLEDRTSIGWSNCYIYMKEGPGIPQKYLTTNIRLNYDVL